MPASNDYVFVTNWTVVAGVTEAYRALSDVPGYLRWWNHVYLVCETLEAPAEDGLGGRYRVLTRGKLPYRLRWEARVNETRRPFGFTVEASGDFVGRGIWTLEEKVQSVHITFDWRLRAEKPLLRRWSFLFKPMFSWNHRWAMARGQEGLARELGSRHARGQ